MVDSFVNGDIEDNVVMSYTLNQDFCLGGKPQITCNDVIRSFRKRNELFVRQRY